MDLYTNTNAGLVWVIIGAFCALAAGTLVRWRSLQNAAADEVKKRLDSLRSWWIISVSVAAAVLLGKVGVTILMAVVSWLAFREFLELVPARPSDRYSRAGVFLLIPVHFVLVYLGWISQASVFLPVALLVLTGTTLVLTSEVKGFTRSASTFCWGSLLTTYALSYPAMLLTTQLPLREPMVGRIGFFLFLVVLTELNDIAQALVGRRLGKRKITPVVSPHKTWEGLVGGMVATGLTAVLVGQWLLPADVGPITRLMLGAGMSVIGFLGDIHMSALKRDVGVKDSGTLLPGQGGMLDRIDSLTFTGPTFFYLAVWLFRA